MLQSTGVAKASEGLLLPDGSAADRIVGKRHKEHQESAEPLVMLAIEHNLRQDGRHRKRLVLLQSNPTRYYLETRFYRCRSHKQSRADRDSEAWILPESSFEVGCMEASIVLEKVFSQEMLFFSEKTGSEPTQFLGLLAQMCLLVDPIVEQVRPTVVLENMYEVVT